MDLEEYTVMYVISSHVNLQMQNKAGNKDILCT